MSNKRWLIVLLILSLMGNLVLIGFVAGRLSDTRLPIPIKPHLGLGPMVRALPEARREALRPIVREHFGRVRPHLREVHRAQLHVYNAILAEPFVEQTLVDALAKFAHALNTSQIEGHPQFVAFVSALTAQERKLVVHALPGPRRHRRRDAHHPGEGP